MSSCKNAFIVNERAKISVITPSLNHGPFLRETIESVLSQTYKNVEHVVIDGASTDNTVDILKEYPNIKWVSEKEYGDNPVLDAIWKAFYMSTGEYIVFLCVTDGLMDVNWFRRAVGILDGDCEVSHVWGLVQGMSEDGQLRKVWNADFLDNQPPQKKDFLPFWLATGEGVECNAVFRRNIFEKCYTRNSKDELCRFAPGLGFNYYLNTLGYLPYFLPVITVFGRIHGDQRGERYANLVGVGADVYFGKVKAYRQALLAGKIKHYFRNGCSEVIGEVMSSDLACYKKLIWRRRLKNNLKRKFQRIINHI